MKNIEIKFVWRKFLGVALPALFIYLSQVDWVNFEWTKAALISVGTGLLAYLWQAVRKFIVEILSEEHE